MSAGVGLDHADPAALCAGLRRLGARPGTQGLVSGLWVARAVCRARAPGQAALRLRWERVLLFAPWLGLTDTLLPTLGARLRARSVGGAPLAEQQRVRAGFADLHIRHALGDELFTRAVAALGRPPQSTEVETAALFLSTSITQLPRELARLTGVYDREVARLDRAAIQTVTRLDPALRLHADIAASLPSEPSHVDL